jgi:hypothetical protein
VRVPRKERRKKKGAVDKCDFTIGSVIAPEIGF